MPLWNTKEFQDRVSRIRDKMERQTASPEKYGYGTEVPPSMEYVRGDEKSEPWWQKSNAVLRMTPDTSERMVSQDKSQPPPGGVWYDPDLKDGDTIYWRSSDMTVTNKAQNAQPLYQHIDDKGQIRYEFAPQSSAMVKATYNSSRTPGLDIGMREGDLLYYDPLRNVFTNKETVTSRPLYDQGGQLSLVAQEEKNVRPIHATFTKKFAEQLQAEREWRQGLAMRDYRNEKSILPEYEGQASRMVDGEASGFTMGNEVTYVHPYKGRFDGDIIPVTLDDTYGFMDAVDETWRWLSERFGADRIEDNPKLRAEVGTLTQLGSAAVATIENVIVTALSNPVPGGQIDWQNENVQDSLIKAASTYRNVGEFFAGGGVLEHDTQVDYLLNKKPMEKGSAPSYKEWYEKKYNKPAEESVRPGVMTRRMIKRPDVLDRTAYREYLNEIKPIVEADRVRLAAEAQDYRKKANDLLMNGQGELAKDMLINQVYPRTRDIVAVDPTWSYTWLGADGKERQSAFFNAMAESELTVGHPLSREQVYSLKERFEDPSVEMAGQMIFDWLNILDVPIPGVVGVKLFGVGTKVSQLGDIPIEMVKGALKPVAKSIGKLPAIDFLLRRSRRSTGYAYAGASDDLFNTLFQAMPTAKRSQRQAFVEETENFVSAINGVIASSDRDAAIETLLKSGKLGPNITRQQVDNAIKLVSAFSDSKILDIKRWSDVVASQYDKLYQDLLDDRMARIFRSRKIKDPALASAEIAEEVRKEAILSVQKEMGNTRRLSHRIGSEFQEAYLSMHRAWGGVSTSGDKVAWEGTKLLDDQIRGMLGAKFPSMRSFLQSTSDLENFITRNWVTATLFRTPRLLINNTIESTFRVIVSAPMSLFGAVQDVFKMPRGLGTSMAVEGLDNIDNPIQRMAERGGRWFPDPVTMIREYAHNIKKSAAFFQDFHGKSFKEVFSNFGETIENIWGLLQSPARTHQGMSSVVEYALRSRLFGSKYSKLLRRMEDAILPGIYRDLESRLVSKGMDRDTIDRVMDVARSAWKTSGGNAKKFREMLNRKGGSVYSRLIPDAVFRSNVGASPTDQHLFLAQVKDELDKVVSHLGRDLTPEESKQFFDSVKETLSIQVERNGVDIDILLRTSEDTMNMGGVPPARDVDDELQRLLELDEAGTGAKKWPRDAEASANLKKKFADAGIDTENKSLPDCLEELRQKNSVLTPEDLDAMDEQVQAEAQRSFADIRADIISQGEKGQNPELVKSGKSRAIANANLGAAYGKHGPDVDRHINEIRYSINDWSSSLKRFYNNVWPGWTRVRGSQTESVIWNWTVDLVSRLDNSNASIFNRTLDDINNGRQTPLTLENFFRSVGIEFGVDENGFTELRIAQRNIPGGGEYRVFKAGSPTFIDFQAMFDLSDPSVLKKTVGGALVDVPNITPAPYSPNLQDILDVSVNARRAMNNGDNKAAAIAIAEEFGIRTATPSGKPNNARVSNTINNARKKMGLPTKPLNELTPQEVVDALTYRASLELPKPTENVSENLGKAVDIAQEKPPVSERPFELDDNVYAQMRELGYLKQDVSLMTFDEVQEAIKKSLTKGSDGTERRVNTYLRSMLDDIPEEERDEALRLIRNRVFTDDYGMKNKLSYLLSKKKPFQISLDISGLKTLNDTYSHENGDILIQAYSSVLDGITDHAYHPHGDEFIVQADTLEEANALVEQIDSAVRRLVIEIEHEGKKINLTGFGIHSGIGPTYKEADGVLNATKAARKAEAGVDPRLVNRVRQIEPTVQREGKLPWYLLDEVADMPEGARATNEVLDSKLADLNEQLEELYDIRDSSRDDVSMGDINSQIASLQKKIDRLMQDHSLSQSGNRGAVSWRKGDGITRSQFAAKLKSVFGYTSEQVQEFMVYHDGFAKTWARENGRKPDEYYTIAYGDLVRGGVGDLDQAARDVDTPAFRAWFGESKVVDEDGQPLVVYHGSQRVDRIAEKKKFDKKRATSGPMAYFTDNPDIASSYAAVKEDTSLYYSESPDFADMFTVKIPGERSKRNIVQAYWHLDAETKATLMDRLPHIEIDDATGDIVYNPEGGLNPEHFMWLHNRNRSKNPIQTAIEMWLEDGTIYGDEQRFIDVLRAAGLDGQLGIIQMPTQDALGVVPAYLSIQNPLDTGSIPQQVVDALENKSKRQKAKVKTDGDLWDKNSRPPFVWVEILKKDITDGTYLAWTSIPDWVTNVLREFGFDGIKDIGGKHGGTRHTVWIPFEETQVKSIHNRGTFSPNDPNILHQGTKGAVSWDDDVKAVIHAFTFSDFSTVVHETAHVWVRMLPDRDVRVLERWFKQNGIEYTQDWVRNTADNKKAHEFLAQGVERLVAEGIAPTPRMKNIFEKFKRWMLDIYGHIAGSDIPVSDEVRSVFNRWASGMSDDLEFWKSYINMPFYKDQSLSGVLGKVLGDIDLDDPYSVLASLNDMIANTPAENKVVLEALNNLKNNLDYAWRYGQNLITQNSLMTPPLNMWRYPENFQNWMGYRHNLVGEWAGAQRSLDEWADALGRVDSFDFPQEAESVLDDWAETAARTKEQMQDAAIYGGKVGDISIDANNAALHVTNNIMLDYTDFSTLSQWMQSIYPFWKFPSKSLPMWAEAIAKRPSLLAAYNKYRSMSRRYAYAHGAINRNGEVLPSFRNYVPIPGTTMWFNPTAALIFRYITPEPNAYYYDEQEDATPFQTIMNWMLDQGQMHGFTPSPLVLAALKALGADSGYPRPGLAYELAKSFIPIEFIPPWIEKVVMNRLQKMVSPNIPDTLAPEVQWKDYMIAELMLQDYLQKIEDEPDEAQRYKLAGEVGSVLSQLDHGDNAIWKKYSDQLDASEYYRKMGSMFTSFYVKDFSSGKAAMIALRDRINVIKENINNQVGADVLGLDADAISRRQAYVDLRYNTPEGWLWNDRMKISFVRDPETNVLIPGGEEWKKAVAQAYDEEERQDAYYQKLSEIQMRLNQKLNASPSFPVSNVLKQQAWKDYWQERADLETNPMFQSIRYKWNPGYRPQEEVEKHYRDMWWGMLAETKPIRDYDGGESYNDYMKRVMAWEQDLSNQAKVLAPMLSTNIAMAYGALSKGQSVDGLFNKIMKSTNADDYHKWEAEHDSIFTAAEKAYMELYINPYFEITGDTANSDERMIAERLFKANFPKPTAEDLWEYVQEKYPDRFTREDFMKIVGDKSVLDVDQRMDLNKTEEQIKTNDIWDVLSWVDPGQGRKDLINQFKLLGGEEWWINMWYETGGDPSVFKQETIDQFLPLLKQAAQALNIKEPSTSRLAERSKAREINDVLYKQIDKDLGGETGERVRSAYFILDDAERRVWRKTNQGMYDMYIKAYYELRDFYAETYPVWMKYYYPDYEPKKKGSGYSSKSSGYSGGGGYRSYNKRNKKKRFAPPSLGIIRMPGRSSGEADDLLDPNRWR